MRHRRLGSLAAALTTTSLALAATAFAADQPAPSAPAAPAAALPAHVLRAGCTQAFTVSDHRRYARRVFHRASISRKARRRLAVLRHCQTHGHRATRTARRAEHRLARWRSLYRCTQSKVVNCIRSATRRYGGSFAHNLACARSESGLNPYARNGGGSGATGLYQFMPSTWSSTLARMHVSRARSIYSAAWQARAAAWKFSHDGFGEWTGAGC